MASNITSRSFRGIAKRAQACYQCANSTYFPISSIRLFSISSPRPEAQYETDPAQRPRWSYTPQQMKAPFPPQRIKDASKPWECNSDPEKLDRFYIKFLGRGGDTVLTEEVKWQAITHKSFDQGRRGFNDRLAFFGRRILNLQTTLALLHSPVATKTQSLPNSEDVVTHPALEGLANLSNVPLGEILTKTRLARLATQMGMREIIRWEPRLKDRLDTSGIDVVLTTSLYAIVGAIALQKGGDVAARVTRERVLKPLGIS